MNRSFRSIWNPSLATFVAAAETQPARGRGVSGTRAARRQACRAGVAPLALEPRIVFDAAIAATVVDVQSDSGADAGDAGVVAAWVADEDSEQAEVDAVAEPVTTEAAEAEAPAAAEPSGDAAVQALEDGAGDDTGEPDTEAQSLDDSDPQATAPEQAPAREIIFVDPVAASLDEHLQDSGAEIIYLSADRDGVEQIAEALQGQTGITAIHIVSHGVEGRLMLGNTVLDAASMQAQHLEALQAIGAALTEEGDILIYGCNFTAGETGMNAATVLAEITGADVAASDDTTGHADQGGDWTLETSVGSIEAAALSPSDWVGTLDLVIQNVGTIGANALATAIMGPGVTINSATYSGGGDQAGVFTTGAGISFGSNILEFTEGAIFTTHSSTTSVAGPNNNEGLSFDAPGVDNDPDFVALSPSYGSFDASFIVINFTPDVFPGANVGDTGRMTASIVFGSEEYNEYVYGGYNDSIGIWVNGTNVALAPNGLAIGIDTINDAGTVNPTYGDPAFDPNPGHSTTSFTSANSNLYVNNSPATYNTQMDGFTVTISLTFNVIIGQQNTIKLGIADTGDSALDSWLFVKAESLQTAFVPENDSVTTPANVPASVDLTANDFNLNGGALDIIAINGTTLAPGGSVVLDSGVTVTLEGGGNVTVTGDGVNAVSDTFTYTVTNADGQTGNAVVSVNITAPVVNSPPVAVDDGFAAGEDDAAAVVGNALTNDSDPDGNPLSAVVQSNVAGSGGGLFSINSAGNVTFNPNGAFEGLAVGETATTSFTYTLSDGQGGSDTATVTVTVTGANDAPVAVDDGFAAGEDDTAAVVGNALTNDSDPDGDTLSATPQTGVAGSGGGLFSINAAGQVTFNPNGEFEGLAPGQTTTTSFTYTVSDGQGGSDTATVTVTVTGANDAPVAVDDGFAAGENDGAAVVGNALTNDSDVDGGTLAATPQTNVAGSHGGLFSINAAGQVTFNPNGEFEGLAAGQTATTSFTYTVSDGQGGSDTATVTVTVTGANDAPVAVDDGFAAGEDDAAAVVGNAITNDSDVDGGTLAATPQTNVAGSHGGLFSINAAGQVTFNPNGAFESLAAGQTATTSFTYTVSDGQGGSDTATVTVTVTGANDAPELVPGSQPGAQTADDGQTIAPLDVSGAFTDVDGDTLGYSATGLPPGLSIDPVTGVISGTISADASQGGPGSDGVYSVTVTATDPSSLSVDTVFSWTIGNPAPVAVNDDLAAGEDDAAAVVGNALGNDSDPDGDTLSATPQSNVAGSHGGLFSIDAAGAVTFDPNGEFEGLAVGQTATTSFTYTVSDGQGGSDTATVTVTVTGANDAPVAVDDSASTDEDTPLTIDVLANDSDTDGDTLTVTTATAGNGTVVINPDGTITYTPDADFHGSDTISYTISDGQGGSATATVTVTVNPVNDAPTLVPGSQPGAQTGDDGELITPLDVSGAFTDVDGDTLGYSASGLPPGLSIDPVTGVISGTLASNASQGGPANDGVYSVTVTATDPSGLSVDTVFSWTIGNPAPVAVNDDLAAGEDDAAAVVGNALGNDSDPDGDTLSATPQSNVAGSHGGLFSIDAAGQVTFDPNGEFEGLAVGQTATSSFTYTVSDGQGGSDTATVTVTVTGANDAPVAVDDDFAASEDDGAAVVGNALTNDSDVDGDTLSATVQTGVVGSHGGLFSIDATGQVSFDPNGEFEALAVGQTATTSFTYTVSDGQGGSDTATVTVTVTGANDAPVAVDDGFAADEDDGAAVLGNALGNDSDVDGGTLSATPQTNVAGSHGGLFSIDAAGQVTFDPNGEFDGLAAGQTATTSFTYTVSDGQGGSDTATVTVTMTGGNDVPVAVDDSVSTDEDTPSTIDVLTNDSDTDGDTLTVTTATAGNGTVVINLDGTITYTPDADFHGSDTISYTISDGQGGSATATVTVTVNPVNDAPVAVNDGPFAVTPGRSVTGNVLTNDSDVDGDALSVTGFAVDTNRDGVAESFVAGQTAVFRGIGTLVVQADGNFVFTPASGYAGNVPVATYTVSDGQAQATASLRFDAVPEVVLPPAPPPPPPAPAPAPAPAPLPTVSPPTDVGATVVSAPVPPATDSSGNVAPELHVLYAVNSAHTEGAIMASGLSLGTSDPLLAEAMAQAPDGLLFEGMAEVSAASLLAPEGMSAGSPALHVQHAVRHEPVAPEHGSYIQRVVRSAQVESRLGDAVVRAQTELQMAEEALLVTRAVGDAPGDSADAPAAVSDGATPPANTPGAAPGGAERQLGGPAALDTSGIEDDQVIEGEAATEADEAAEQIVNTGPTALGFRDQLVRMAQQPGGWGRPVTRVAVAA